MTLLIRLAAACLAFPLCAAIALPQESKEAKDNPPSEEDGRLERVIERWVQANETERDHVLREVSRNSDGKTDDDFGHWFMQLGGSETGWDRTRIQRRNAAEIFDRIATRLRLSSPILKRAEFVAYAKQYWGKDKSPLWREPQPFETIAEAERLFKHLDRDRDGYLHTTEIRPSHPRPAHAGPSSAQIGISASTSSPASSAAAMSRSGRQSPAKRTRLPSSSTATPSQTVWPCCGSIDSILAMASSYQPTAQNDRSRFSCGMTCA
jgi:hypothetical protein